MALQSRRATDSDPPDPPDPPDLVPPLSDALIIERSVRDPEEFALLFQRHSASIFRYVARRLGPDAADDVVADTFLQAFRHRSRYRSDYPDARPWLYGIATRLVGRHRRAEIRQYRALARTGIDVIAESFTDQVDTRVTASAATRQLASTLAALSPGYRDAILLVAWADLTYDEAAKALGVPVGTVRSRLSRARARLRAEITELDLRGEDS